MLSSCSSPDAQQRRLKSDCYQKQQFVFVFEEFEFCIKELVLIFEEHIGGSVVVLFKFTAEKERNRNSQFFILFPAEEQFIGFEEQVFG